MGTISQVPANNRNAAASAAVGNDGDNNLYKVKLVFSPSELGLNGKRPENIRATNRENESAKLLAEQGYKVRQLPDATKGKVQGVKKPDFEIEGRVFDNYAPLTGNARDIAKVLEEKLGETQAERFVLNLSNSKVGLETLKKQLQDYPIAGLKEIIIIKDGKVIQFFLSNR